MAKEDRGISRDYRAVGQAIRDLRKNFKIKQFELAQRLGISPALMSLIEAGKRPNSTMSLERIASEFGLTASDIIGENPNCLRAYGLIEVIGLANFYVMNTVFKRVDIVDCKKITKALEIEVEGFPGYINHHRIGLSDGRRLIESYSQSGVRDYKDLVSKPVIAQYFRKELMGVYRPQVAIESIDLKK